MTDINKMAPDFVIETDNGEFSLKSNLGKNIVIFFFPKADTPG